MGEDLFKKLDIEKWLFKTLVSIVIAFTVFAYGVLVGRVERVENITKSTQARISAVEGDIKEIRTNIEWLKVMRERYEKDNGSFNMEEFLRTLFAKK